MEKEREGGREVEREDEKRERKEGRKEGRKGREGRKGEISRESGSLYMQATTHEGFYPLGRPQLVPVPVSCPLVWLYGNIRTLHTCTYTNILTFYYVRAVEK